MTVQTHETDGGTVPGALRAAWGKVAGFFRTAAEIYVAGRELEARTLASLDERILRDMGINPQDLRYWKAADKTLAPAAGNPEDEFRRAA